MLSSTSCMEKTREDQEEPQNKLTKKYQDTSQEYQEEQIWGWRLGNFYVLRLLSYLLSRGKRGGKALTPRIVLHILRRHVSRAAQREKRTQWRLEKDTAARHHLLHLGNQVWGPANIRAVRKAGARLPNKEQAIRLVRWLHPAPMGEVGRDVEYGLVWSDPLAKAYLPLSIVSNLPAVFPTSPLQPPIGPTTWIRADLLRKQHSVPG